MHDNKPQQTKHGYCIKNICGLRDKLNPTKICHNTEQKQKQIPQQKQQQSQDHQSSRSGGGYEKLPQ